MNITFAFIFFIFTLSLLLLFYSFTLLLLYLCFVSPLYSLSVPFNLVAFFYLQKQSHHLHSHYNLHPSFSQSLSQLDILHNYLPPPHHHHHHYHHNVMQYSFILSLTPFTYLSLLFFTYQIIVSS
ncbi:hypothetical protein GQ42DRAFT_88314 [Ramicandelaber brevisporus]|nr:hypothetical protein GQ42DRAFT_88314 [Ramicandelaber brevisporus]